MKNNHPICNHRIGLDIDGVLSNFGQQIIQCSRDMGISEHFPEDWTKIDKWMFSSRFLDVWNAYHKDSQFWLSIPPFEAAKKAIAELTGFAPVLYLTSRPVAGEISSEWLAKHGFPKSTVVTVTKPEDKVNIILNDYPADLFIDDHVSTVRLMRAAGINAVLYAAPHQISENTTGLPVIKCLSEMINHVSMDTSRNIEMYT